MTGLTLKPRAITLAELRRIARGRDPVALAEGWRKGVDQSLAALGKRLAAGEALYGINTGFGKLAKTRISTDELATLQLNLVRSHAAGVGAPLADTTVRLVLVLKAASIARGFSGVRPVLIERLLQLVNAGIFPLVPGQGSVGASGDLAPLAHLALTLIGEGRVRVNGQELDSAKALKNRGHRAAAARPEGRARAPERHAGLDRARARSAVRGGRPAGRFDRERRDVGGSRCSAAACPSTRASMKRAASRRRRRSLRHFAACSAMKARSAIRTSTAIACRIPIRCAASRRSPAPACSRSRMPRASSPRGEWRLGQSAGIRRRAARCLSGGNFHAEPVAFAADNLALAIAEIGALAERRIAMLIDDNLSQLPAFLVKHGGLNSGFMIAQVTAAALASENKSLAHPASVDSLPTSANQEDHVSMATFAARRLRAMAENTRGIVAIELLAAAQGLDFRRPLKSSPALESAHMPSSQVRSPSTTTTGNSRPTSRRPSPSSRATISFSDSRWPRSEPLTVIRRAGRIRGPGFPLVRSQDSDIRSLAGPRPPGPRRRWRCSPGARGGGVSLSEA